ncbi:hypothetical protein GH733_018103 [Mirounga leonina]|nr:hypothetical protein GH733_018103 [Mirounga leonina]
MNQQPQRSRKEICLEILRLLEDWTKLELKFGLKLKPGILAATAALARLLVLAEVGAAGKCHTADRYRASHHCRELFTQVDALVLNELGVLTKATATLSRSSLEASSLVQTLTYMVFQDQQHFPGGRLSHTQEGRSGGTTPLRREELWDPRDPMSDSPATSGDVDYIAVKTCFLRTSHSVHKLRLTRRHSGPKGGGGEGFSTGTGNVH